MVTLSEMICSARCIAPVYGDVSGTCVYCGEKTVRGQTFKAKSQFTTYQLMQGGTVICQYCNMMNMSQEYRTSMWAVNESKFYKFKHSQAKLFLQKPPDPPFVMYFTRTWKKQGWPQLSNQINTDKACFIVGFDYSLIYVEAEKRDSMLELAQVLIDKKITKTEILTGELKSKSYLKIDYDLDIITRLKELSMDPLWDLCVYLTREKYDKREP